MKIVVLAGGVGGAKLVHGLSLVLPAEDLTAIVNTGDDFLHLGLHVSPDLDTVMYTLAGLANPETGWGIAGDTFHSLDGLERLGGPTWFRLGDRDLATHLRRTLLLAEGLTLSEATRELCDALEVRPRVIPMTDATVATKVATTEGELDFQDYFVRRACEPRVTGFRFEGVEAASPAPEALAALRVAEAVIIGPSNPFVSIEPILSLPGIREAIAAKPAVAVSPIVGGQAIKGPAAKMLAELGLDVSARAVAALYADITAGFVLDAVDIDLAPQIEALGLAVKVAQTVMRSDSDRAELAKEALAFVSGLSPRSPA